MKRFVLVIIILAFSSLCFGEVLLIETMPKTLFSYEESPYVYMSIIIKTGIVSDAGYNAGMTSFISKLILEQTRLTDAEELQRIFYSAGCNLKMEVTLDYLEIKVITLKDSFPKAIDIIGECLTEPKITKDDIKKAKIESIDMMTEDYASDYQRLYDTLRQNIYTGSPYKMSLYGTIQSIKNIDANSINRYYKENFSPNNMVISIIGDLDKDETQQNVLKAFSGGYKTQKRSVYDYTEKRMSNKTCNIVNYSDSDILTYYMQGYLMPSVKDNDYYACLLLSNILGGGKSSYVFTDIRQKYGIGYMVGFRYENLRRQSHGYFYLSCIDNDKNKIKVAKEAFSKIIGDLKTDGVSEEDLNRWKVFINEQNKIEQLDLMEKAHKISWYDAICGDYSQFDKFSENINNVTNEDIRRVVNKYFTNYCEIISFPKENYD